MADRWFSLSREERAEALEVAAANLGRPPHLLEKDIWVVWALSVISASSLADKLTFKGGTSLSKVYAIIDRFSEDVDLTCDIRELAPDMLEAGNAIPRSASQAKKITDEVRRRLPVWLRKSVLPVFSKAMDSEGVSASLRIEGDESNKLVLAYEPIKVGTGYAAPAIQLEFGARATGEPHQRHRITCDIASAIAEVEFPVASPLVMSAERTFWEKATAAHVYCLQNRLRGDRYSRHWYDLACMSKSGHAATAVADRELANAVAEHKSAFFVEKDERGTRIDYRKAVAGAICLVPEGDPLGVLQEDYEAMLGDGLLAGAAMSFDEVIALCKGIQQKIRG